MKIYCIHDWHSTPQPVEVKGTYLKCYRCNAFWLKDVEYKNLEPKTLIGYIES